MSSFAAVSCGSILHNVWPGEWGKAVSQTYPVEGSFRGAATECHVDSSMAGCGFHCMVPEGSLGHQLSLMITNRRSLQ